MVYKIPNSFVTRDKRCIVLVHQDRLMSLSILHDLFLTAQHDRLSLIPSQLFIFQAVCRISGSD
jgi:hypothetical protein